jgi:hypothetical protein
MRYFFLPLLLAGCASVPSDRAIAVYEVDIQQVEGCELLGQVSGYSGHGGVMGSGTGNNNAVNAAKEDAAALGANRIVWIAESSHFGTKRVGRAYRCGP